MGPALDFALDMALPNAALNSVFTMPTPVQTETESTPGNRETENKGNGHLVFDPLPDRMWNSNDKRGLYVVGFRKDPQVTIERAEWISIHVSSPQIPQTIAIGVFGGIPGATSFTYNDSSASLIPGIVPDDLLGTHMHIAITLAVPDSAGETISHSPIFTVDDSVIPGDTQARVEFMNRLNESEVAGFSESSDTDNTASLRTTTALAPVSTGDGNPTSSGGSTLDGASSSAGRGLSNGAIAGIAVGCGLVFLIAVGLLLWFLWRRRRRDVDHVKSATYDGRVGTHDYMNDKETHGRVAESPHSPYSDDGLRRDSALLNDRDLHVTQDRPFAPYSDAGSAQPSDPIAQDANHAPPQGVPTAVAHLVEEGMTRDEIRRLEEEERALDQAIEQAGRH